MRDLSDIAAFLEAHAALRGLLAIVEDLHLPDAWIGAGLVRNAIWDVLHGRDADLAAASDVDVIFFDTADLSERRDAALEERLRCIRPGLDWQVRNQARMHLRNGDAPYHDTQHAIAHWPETATAIAARIEQGRITVIAPHGIEDLLACIVRPTPAFAHKMDVYRERLAGKDWRTRWPRLRFTDSET